MSDMSEAPIYGSRYFEVQALQFTGGETNADEILAWLQANDTYGLWSAEEPVFHKETPEGVTEYEGAPETFFLRTTSGDLEVPSGWWVVRLPDDSFTPVSPELFKLMYIQVSGMKLKDLAPEPEVDFTAKVEFEIQRRPEITRAVQVPIKALNETARDYHERLREVAIWLDRKNAHVTEFDYILGTIDWTQGDYTMHVDAGDTIHVDASGRVWPIRHALFEQEYVKEP